MTIKDPNANNRFPIGWVAFAILLVALGVAVAVVGGGR